MCGKREVEVAAIAAEPKDKVLPRAPVRSARALPIESFSLSECIRVDSTARVSYRSQIV